MSVTLQGLSAEVLNLIISFCDGKSALAAFGRTSKLFYSLTLPYLYRDISLSRMEYDSGIQHLRPLTLTLLQKPKVAALVRSFSVRPSYWTPHMDEAQAVESEHDEELEWISWRQHPDVNRVLIAAINARLPPGLGVPEPPRARAKEQGKARQGTDPADQWLRLARMGYNEASILALLLPNLINLQSLDVPFHSELWGAGQDGNVRFDTHYMEDMLEDAITGLKQIQGQPIFANLTDVIVPGFVEKLPDNPLFLALCAGLPAIKRLYGFNQGNQHGQGAAIDLPDGVFRRLKPGSSSVELIHLRHSKLKSSNFTALIRAPKRLKTLIYEIGNTVAWNVFEFPQLQLAVDTQKTCLERLCISHSRYYPFAIDMEELAPPLTFHDFTALRNLQIAPVYLYGNERLQFSFGEPERSPEAPEVTETDFASTRMLLSEVLPNQLQTLDLVYCSDESTLRRVLLGLEHLLSQKPDRFPDLREVSIHGTNVKNLRAVLPAFKNLAWKENAVHFLVISEGKKISYDGQVPWGWDEDVEWRECHQNYRGKIRVIYDNHQE